MIRIVLLALILFCVPAAIASDEEDQCGPELSKTGAETTDPEASAETGTSASAGPESSPMTATQPPNTSQLPAADEFSELGPGFEALA